MNNKITVYWTRQSEAESVPLLSAYRKEEDVKDFLGVPVPGGRKYTIPDIEENREIVESMSGKWGTNPPKTAAPKPVLTSEEPQPRRPGRPRA